jgi:hypothetical protein
VAKPPSTVIHAGWLVRRRAGRVFLPKSDMGQVPPQVKHAAETIVADANNLRRIDRFENPAAIVERARHGLQG